MGTGPLRMIVRRTGLGGACTAVDVHVLRGTNELHSRVDALSLEAGGGGGEFSL